MQYAPVTSGTKTVGLHMGSVNRPGSLINPL